jgi:hypothetical protein
VPPGSSFRSRRAPGRLTMRFIEQISPRATTPTLSPLTVTRSPRHTPAERRTTHEAGLLAPGSPLSSAFPRPLASVAYWTIARRLQLRGQPRFHIRVPFHPFREPRAELNANGFGQIRSIRMAERGFCEPRCPQNSGISSLDEGPDRSTGTIRRIRMARKSTRESAA